MKLILILPCLLLSTFISSAKQSDTIYVKPENLQMNSLRTGDYSYIVFNKKTKDSPARRIVLIRFNVEKKLYHDKPAIFITQQWDLDTVVHSSSSVFDAKTFATIVHDTYWQRLGYSMKFDFDEKKVEFKNTTPNNGVPDSVRTKSIADFNDSFNKYNLNWHEDLIVYTLLPYNDKRTFMINYYDPGFSKAEEVAYTVTGSALLTGGNGEKIECWVLNYIDKAYPGSYERFWISKKTKEVLKEEDFFNHTYRYKLKIGVSSDK